MDNVCNAHFIMALGHICRQVQFSVVDTYLYYAKEGTLEIKIKYFFEIVVAVS